MKTNIIEDLCQIQPSSKRKDAAFKQAHQQAGELLRLCNITGPPVSTAAIAKKLGIAIEVSDKASTSGVNDVWRITVDGRQTRYVNDFIVLGAIKRIIDRRASNNFADGPDYAPLQYAFASWVLMPEAWLSKRYRDCVREIYAAAKRFDVTPEAMWSRFSETTRLSEESA